VIGFGSSFFPVNVTGVTIDLSGSPTDATDMAFSLPRSGALAQLSAFFSNVLAVALPAALMAVHVEIWRSAAPGSNTFVPTGDFVNIVFAGPIVGTEFLNATAALATLVNNEDRLLLVVSLTATGIIPEIGVTVEGYLSAGLAIS
jgi:BclB C-terminal domain-containing protein